MVRESVHRQPITALVISLRFKIFIELNLSVASMPLQPKKPFWGIEGYLAPTNDWALTKVKTYWSKQKKENFMEI